MERKLLQVVFAITGLVLVWRRGVARAAQRSALTR